MGPPKQQDPEYIKSLAFSKREARRKVGKRYIERQSKEKGNLYVNKCEKYVFSIKNSKM